MSETPDFNTYVWLDLVTQVEPDYYAADEGVYEFSDGHKFDSTDNTDDSGIYGG
jgi:hypothetical protein